MRSTVLAALLVVLAAPAGLVNDLVAGNRLSEGTRAAYVHHVDDVRILAPILYPSKLMNAAVNFYTHACEGCTEEELKARTRERQENRGVPYLFLKPTRGAISASIEGIGTLTHTVRAEEGVPADLSGSQLPPVETYRPPR